MEADLFGFVATCLYYISEPFFSFLFWLFRSPSKEEELVIDSLLLRNKGSEFQTPSFLKPARKWFEFGIEIDITDMHEGEISSVKAYVKENLKKYSSRVVVAQQLHGIDPKERIIDTMVFVRYVSVFDGVKEYERFD